MSTRVASCPLFPPLNIPLRMHTTLGLNLSPDDHAWLGLAWTLGFGTLGFGCSCLILITMIGILIKDC